MSELYELMPGQFPPDAYIASTAVRVNGDDNGNFDELFGSCSSVHLEMMNDGTLWMEFTMLNQESVVVIASAQKRGKLFVKVEVNP